MFTKLINYLTNKVRRDNYTSSSEVLCLSKNIKIHDQDDDTLSTSYVYFFRNKNFKNISKTLIIPEGFKILIFTNVFDDSIDNVKLIIPFSLEKISFGDNFNSPISKQFSFKNVKEISFGKKFNQKDLKLFLPNVERIIFGKRFVQSIDNIFFNKIKEIYLYSKKFNKIIENKSLQTLWFNKETGKFNEDKDNPHIIKIYFYSKKYCSIDVENLYYRNKFFELYFYDNFRVLLKNLKDSKINESQFISQIILCNGKNDFLKFKFENKNKEQNKEEYDCPICLNSFSIHFMKMYSCRLCEASNIKVCKICVPKLKDKCIICNNR